MAPGARHAKNRFARDPGQVSLPPVTEHRPLTLARVRRRISPVHLVRGRLDEPEALAARAVVAQNVPLDTLRQAVTATLPPAADPVPDLIPFDPQARKALELTFREALRMGHSYIGTEHILLALLELEDGAGTLAGAGLDKAAAEATITAAIAALTARHEQ